MQMLEGPDCAIFERPEPYQIRKFVTRALPRKKIKLLIFFKKPKKKL